MLHAELDVPVGLINSSVGGTAIESWTSMPAQTAVAAIKPRLDAWKQADDQFDGTGAKARYERALEQWQARRAASKAEGKPAPRRPQVPIQPRSDRNYPANLYNGKIQPLVGYTIRGAIWYQGESSAGRGFAHLYEPQLETLIADWRARWGQGDFPFAWVQLPNFRQPQQQPSETSGWVLVQEGMLKTLTVPNTGMAITIDVGEADDIHPRNKQAVGKRLSLWALGSVYGRDNETCGPIYRSSTRDGKRVVIEFDHATSGLVAKGGEPVGFAIAGSDRQFQWARAKIDGSRVIVWSEEVPDPVSVRYAWASNPKCNVYNKAGLPASPFRTDTWDETIIP
jgi:sialate O-acetylesterase